MSDKTTLPRRNKAAVKLGKLRWKGVTPEERSRLMRATIQARWAKKAKEA